MVVDHTIVFVVPSKYLVTSDPNANNPVYSCVVSATLTITSSLPYISFEAFIFILSGCAGSVGMGDNPVCIPNGARGT